MSLSLLFDFFPLQDYSVTSWSLPSPELHCLHTWTSFSHRPLFLRPSVCFIRLLSCTFVFEVPLFTWLPAHLSVRPADPADDLLLHWNHLTLFFCLLSGPVLFVEWESQTQVRGSPHFIRFILRGTWLSERLSRSVDQWQLPHFNNGK